jgi:hypothetical protein
MLKLGSGYGTLYAQARAISGIHFNQSGEDFHLSFDLESQMSKILYKDESLSMMPRLGILKPIDIKNGVMEKKGPVRYVATYFPGVDAPLSVHDSFELPTVITRHDILHAHITRWYPKEGVKTIVDIIQQYESLIGTKMSKEIWLLTDMIAEQFLAKSKPRCDKSFFKNYFTDEGLGRDHVCLKNIVFRKGQLTLFGAFLFVYFSLKEEVVDTKWLIGGGNALLCKSILGEFKHLPVKQKVWLIWKLQEEGFNPRALERLQSILESKSLIPVEKVLNGCFKNTYQFA